MLRRSEFLIDFSVLTLSSHGCGECARAAVAMAFGRRPEVELLPSVPHRLHDQPRLSCHHQTHPPHRHEAPAEFVPAHRAHEQCVQFGVFQSQRRPRPQHRLGERSEQRVAAGQLAYLSGVATVIVVAWLAVVGLELIVGNSNEAGRDFELTIQLVLFPALFPVVLVLMCATALVPFVVVRQCGGFVVRKCGGFGNAWQDVGGGIATAVLSFPMLVWECRFVDLENGPGPYLPALAAAVAVPSLWLVVVGSGAIGGLAYWFLTDRA
jgi:hypothetical protein